MASDLASPGMSSTELERVAHYREQAAQFRQWGEKEAIPRLRDGLLDMARQYERLASEIEAKAGTRARRKKTLLNKPVPPAPSNAVPSIQGSTRN
jgi:hypothetical protein